MASKIMNNPVKTSKPTVIQGGKPSVQREVAEPAINHFQSPGKSASAFESDRLRHAILSLRVAGVGQNFEDVLYEISASDVNVRARAHVEGQTPFAWHYTTGEKFQLIKNERLLRPAYLGVVPPERPVLWFSTNPVFEPTAMKARLIDGKRQALTLRELYDLAHGVVRFGCPLHKLKHGPDLRKSAKIQGTVWNALASSAKRVGADPTEWWGHVGPMQLDEVVVEVMNADLKWTSSV
jgi:hypothetical protein